MGRSHKKSMAMAALLAASFGLLSLASGCTASGVGDPCIPEAIPGNGFTETEVYVETSAVQCRTRVCVVFHLNGHPENLQSDGCPLTPTAAMPGCVEDRNPITNGTPFPPDDINRVFCSCRCRAGEGNPNLPICACSDGYHCADEGYCVPHEADGDYCDAEYQANCPGACNLVTNRCR
jgi:hypothetical protein